MTTSTETQTRIEAIRKHLAGTLVTASDREFEDARRVHDVSFDRHPAAVLRAGDTKDVIHAVRLAADLGLEIAVRSGGHSMSGHGSVDDAIVIDLSGLKGIVIDPIRRVAQVQAGATSGDLAGPANQYGLALTTGDAASVGLGGLTTGGGIGWMVRKYGLTIDHLRSAQVVTADGRLLTASPQQHADLFWAIRGGGGNFGIVTEFEFDLDPVANVFGGVLALPATAEVLRGYLDYIVQAPEDLTTIGNLMHAPPAPFIPEAHVGTPVLLVQACWTGDLEAGEQAIAPLRALGPVAEAVGPMPYPSMYLFTEAASAPHAGAIRSMFADTIDDAAIASMLEALEGAPSPISMVQLRGLGGAMSRVPSDATAFVHRDANYLVAVLGLWLDGDEDRAPYDAWVEALWGQVKRLGRGVYVNFLADEGDDRIREAYSAATLARLADVKRRYDPDNLFHLNQNVRP